MDAELDESLRDEQPEISDQDGETQSEAIRSLIKEALDNDKVTIQVQSLKGGEEASAATILSRTNAPDERHRRLDGSAVAWAS